MNEEETPQQEQLLHVNNLQRLFANTPEQFSDLMLEHGVRVQGNNILYDADDPEQVRRYEKLRDTLKTTDNLLIGEAKFDPSDNEQEAWRKLAVAFGVQLGAKDEFITLLDCIAEEKRVMTILLDHPDLLNQRIQARFRGFFQEAAHEAHVQGKDRNIGLIALGTFANWNEPTSPLENIFTSDRNTPVAEALEINPVQLESVIKTFNTTFEKLSGESKVAEVNLKSGSGKSTVALFAADLLPEDVVYINCQRKDFQKPETSEVDIAKLPKNEGKVAIVDEAQMLTDTQIIELGNRYGKVILLQNEYGTEDVGQQNT